MQIAKNQACENRFQKPHLKDKHMREYSMRNYLTTKEL